jgi:ribonuclease VapC
VDASSLLAVLLKECGADVVEERVGGAALSAVNYSEVLKKAVEKGGTLEEAASAVRSLGLEIIPFEEWNAADAARLYPESKSKGLSFADRACLSLAIELDAPLYTSDQRLADVNVPIGVVLIREPAAIGEKRRK